MALNLEHIRSGVRMSEVWINPLRRKLPEFPSENSETNNIYGIGTRFENLPSPLKKSLIAAQAVYYNVQPRLVRVAIVTIEKQ